jgi:predicted nuclease with RNAse H fold
VEVVALGIDYGSKTSGFTAMASYCSSGEVQIFQSTKGKDADAWILSLIDELKPQSVAIDAPLSLPGVYTDPTFFKNYHYRECDRLTGAMSPMFLGGLTARAMQLKAKLKSQGIESVIETYPKMVCSLIGLDMKRYKKDVNYLQQLRFSDYLEDAREVQEVQNWHQWDALMALLACLKHQNGTATSLGDHKEGIIYF